MTDQTKTEKLIYKIADIRYRNDYSGKELKEFTELPSYLQHLYLAEAIQTLQACKEYLIFRNGEEIEL